MSASKEAISAPTNTTDREIFQTRIFDAPRELVWKVWTEPEHIGKWYGPIGFKTVTEKMDVKPGGEWIHVMHGPDGRKYDNKLVYVEIVKPERIVYDHVSPPPFRTTVTFEKLGEKPAEKTQLSMRMVFESVELRDKVAKEFRAVEGLTQTLGRLGEHLASYPVIVERSLAAPIATVWKALTERAQMKRWFFPTLESFQPEVGFQTEFDVQHNGKNYPHQWKVVKVVPESRIAFEWQYKGHAGNSLVTIELFRENNGTRLKLTHEGLETFPQDTSDFVRGNFVMGWNHFINEKLPEYLAAH
jgi:uncharacterized protein YndB with AHSA1/START domain